jgi:hypothetical protein
MKFLYVILKSRILFAKSSSLGFDSTSSLFLYLFFVVLTGQVKKKAEFTVTVLRLIFLGQHPSERLERSEDTHLFLSEEFPLKIQYAIFKCYLIFTIEHSDSFDLPASVV